MQLFDNVTFGPSGLDRAAHLRFEDQVAEVLEGRRAGDAIVLWRGKPLLSDGDARDLIRLPLDHELFREGGVPILLGLEDASLTFAYDISGWPPDQDIDPGFIDLSEQQHPSLPKD